MKTSFMSDVIWGHFGVFIVYFKYICHIGLVVTVVYSDWTKKGWIASFPDEGITVGGNVAMLNWKLFSKDKCCNVELRTVQ